MAKIVVFVWDSTALTLAEDIIAEKQLDAKAIFTDSEHLLNILKNERARGALVAVARGNHAHLIKEHTDIPLSEIVMTGQELTTLISKAQALLGRPDDRIALIGFYSMFSDVRPIADALHANVKVYCAENTKAVGDMVQRACNEGAKLIIGGAKALEYAGEKGVRTMFLDPSKDSITAALAAAKRTCYGIEMEQKKAADFMSLMDYTFDAILRLDQDGVIRMVNANAEIAFHAPKSKIIGRYIFDLLDAHEVAMIRHAVIERREVHATILRIGGEEYIANLASVGQGENFEGFILSMQQFSSSRPSESDGGGQQTGGEHVASARLEEYRYPSEAMGYLVSDAYRVAAYDMPVLITGAYGTDKARLAEAIHNAGAHADKPFVRLNLADVPQEMQQQNLCIVSGARSQKTAFESALSGTVLLENIEMLAPSLQPYLTYICQHGWLLGSNMQPAFPVSCRIIATTSLDLNDEEGRARFSPALFYALSRALLRVPSMSERAEDFELLLDEKLKRCAQRYDKNVRIAQRERSRMADFIWQDDELELERFVEKLVLYAPERDISEALITRVQRYTRVRGVASEEQQSTAARSGEEAQLKALAEKYRGNRELMADALGISKTTLWRKLKRYGLVRGAGINPEGMDE